MLEAQIPRHMHQWLVLGSAGHQSLEVHHLNFNSYCIVGSQVAGTANGLGNPKLALKAVSG